MGQSKDKKQRTRRKKTNAEKEETRRIKESKRRKQERERHGSVSSFFTRGEESEVDADDAVDANIDDVGNSNETADVATADNDGIVTTDDVPLVVANLDIDEDLCDELDVEAEAEVDVTVPTKLKPGVHLDYMRSINDRLKVELQNKTKGLERKWLLDYLKANDGWIRKEQATSMIQRMRSKKQSPSTYEDVDITSRPQNKFYYRDIKVWVPDVLLLGGCAPFCPTCKSNSRVKGHGYHTNHVGRLIIGLTQNYHVLTRRYKCSRCEEKNAQLQRAALATAASTGEAVSKVKHKYTFMGYDAESVPLTAYGCGDEFPAYLTWRAGIDKTLLDMMRAEFDKGMRPEAFSNMVLELHAKEHTRSWLRYEREYAHEKLKHAILGNEIVWDEFSSFENDVEWNDTVPTGRYFATAYKKFSASLRPHFDKEVKKRGARHLSYDVSYKEAKNLCQHNGKPIFNGLGTGTNEIGEVRIQYHVVSDSHDQLRGPLEAFKQTSREYGLPQPSLVHTDDPSRDCNFFMDIFESLQEEKMRLNSERSSTPNVNEYPYDQNMPQLKVVSKMEDIRLAVTSMREIMNEEKGMALDSEHKVVFNGRGMKTLESKIGLIQFAYYNRNANDRIQYLFVRTNNITKLPGPLVSLLSGTVPVVGVNVGGDLARIARDFNLGMAIGRRPKKTIVNLGTYARKRDVIQNGSIGMKPLVKRVLGLTIDKEASDTFSDWNAKELTPSQIKYALIDVDAPLKVYEELSSKPDLTTRLTCDEAVIGKRVDIVPRFGQVACMATRAATGRIVNAEYCESPVGIVQTKVRAGKGTAAVQLETVYSPSLEIPHYCKVGHPENPTLADFGCGQLVVPVQMLKEHVESEEIRPYPSDDANNKTAGTTPPASYLEATNRNGTRSEQEEITQTESAQEPQPNLTLNDAGQDDSEDLDVTVTNEYPSEDGLEEILVNLTTSDIEMLRACAIEGSSMGTNQSPLQCEWLSDPPRADEIEDVYSPLLGDVFHAMQRPYVPIQHEAKKGYFVALQNAFFDWNKDQMKELTSKLTDSGLSSNEIENMKYYNARLFINCVEREVPPPSYLYWRVRAVFAMYGSMIDSKTNKPLFNAKAWGKAKGVLREILKGYYSDPPGVCMYNKRTRKDGSVYKNQYGIDMIECIRGTNRTEAYHKNLIITFRSWHTGIEMSDALLSERRHRHNHRVSQLRRFGFPTLGYCDTWLIDQLQVLVLQNRDRVLYSSWSNASEFKETAESFDTVAIHNTRLHESLKDEWDNRIDKTAVKLTSDQSHMCKSMNIDLPFLPFSTKEENIAFAECALRNDFPMDDPEAAAIEWCKLVDGVNIYSKTASSHSNPQRIIPA